MPGDAPDSLLVNETAPEEEIYNECEYFLPLIPELVQAEIEDNINTIGQALAEFYPHLVELRDHMKKCASCDKNALCLQYYEEVQELGHEVEDIEDFVPAEAE